MTNTNKTLSDGDLAAIAGYLADTDGFAADVATCIGFAEQVANCDALAGEIAEKIGVNEIANEINTDSLAAEIAENPDFIGEVADKVKGAVSDLSESDTAADGDGDTLSGSPSPYGDADGYGIDRAKTPTARREFLIERLTALAGFAGADGSDNGRRLANAADALARRIGGRAYLKLINLTDAARYIAADAVNKNSPLSACGLGDDGDGYDALKECATALTANAVLADADDGDDRKALTACGIALFALAAVSDLPARDGGVK